MKKKCKTTLNAHWIRQFFDKNDDEYATQATFCLSHFDAMTEIVPAEPIPNDVKFHIILGQNWVNTQAKYVFFQKHNRISTSFCACCTKTLAFSHTKYTRNTLEVDLMMMKLCKTHVRKTGRRVVYVNKYWHGSLKISSFEETWHVYYNLPTWIQYSVKIPSGKLT